MASILADAVLDGGLSVLDTLAQKICLCTASLPDAPTYLEATSTYAIGVKDFGGNGSAVNGLSAASPNGRQATTFAVTDGAVSASGTATRWAIVGASANVYAVGSLSASQVYTSGNVWTLPAFTVAIPNQ
jgi:hypothetical protein